MWYPSIEEDRRKEQLTAARADYIDQYRSGGRNEKIEIETVEISKLGKVPYDRTAVWLVFPILRLLAAFVITYFILGWDIWYPDEGKVRAAMYSGRPLPEGHDYIVLAIYLVGLLTVAGLMFKPVGHLGLNPVMMHHKGEGPAILLAYLGSFAAVWLVGSAGMDLSEPWYAAALV